MRIRLGGCRIDTINVATGWPIFKCAILRTHIIISSGHFAIVVSFFRKTWCFKYCKKDITGIHIRKHGFLLCEKIQIYIGGHVICLFLLKNTYSRELVHLMNVELMNLKSSKVSATTAAIVL